MLFALGGVAIARLATSRITDNVITDELTTVLAVPHTASCCRFEREGVGGQRLIHLDIEVDADPVLALPSSKTCFRLTPRAVIDPDRHLGQVLRTFGSLATSSSFSVFTPSSVSGPRYLISHFSARSLPLAPKPSIR